MDATAGNGGQPPPPKSRFAWLQADVTPLVNGIKGVGQGMLLVLVWLAFLSLAVAVFWSVACYRRSPEPTTPAPKFDAPYLRKVDPAVENRIRELELITTGWK